MKKLALTALAAVIATLGVVATASAGSRNNDDEWPRDDRDWGGRRDHDRSARRDRHDDDDWRHGHHRRHWRHHHRHRFVFRDDYDNDYCFVQRVRRYDEWGNMYIRRIQVCR
jgi:hypothetical protein